MYKKSLIKIYFKISQFTTENENSLSSKRYLFYVNSIKELKKIIKKYKKETIDRIEIFLPTEIKVRRETLFQLKVKQFIHKTKIKFVRRYLEILYEVFYSVKYSEDITSRESMTQEDLNKIYKLLTILNLNFVKDKNRIIILLNI